LVTSAPRGPDIDVVVLSAGFTCLYIVFSWILWPSRQARDEGMKKVMADPRVKPDVNPVPFDGKRLIFGGFEMIVEA
jgi:uncharacterized protein YbaA (DUF1428 family)